MNITTKTQQGYQTQESPLFGYVLGDDEPIVQIPMRHICQRGIYHVPNYRCPALPSLRDFLQLFSKRAVHNGSNLSGSLEYLVFM